MKSDDFLVNFHGFPKDVVWFSVEIAQICSKSPLEFPCHQWVFNPRPTRVSYEIWWFPWEFPWLSKGWCSQLPWNAGFWANVRWCRFLSARNTKGPFWLSNACFFNNNFGFGPTVLNVSLPLYVFLNLRCRPALQADSNLVMWLFACVVTLLFGCANRQCGDFSCVWWLGPGTQYEFRWFPCEFLWLSQGCRMAFYWNRIDLQ